jgi:nicotinate-nucleotide adenylyltransferase
LSWSGTRPVGQRIGVFGGTFDPIHHGHLVAAEEVRVVCGLDRVVFMPAGTPPHKLGQRVTPAEHRLEMVQLGIAANPYFTCSTIDIDRPGPSFTVTMLELLHDRWGPETDIYFIMGRDSLADLPNWHQPLRLIELAHIVVVDRPRYEVDMAHLEKTLPGISECVEFVHIPGMAIASSEIQRRVRAGLPIKYQVPDVVEAYIYAQNLYPTE